MKKTPANILIVGSPAGYPDLRYATGFFSFDPVIFLRTGHKTCLVVSPLDCDHVRRITKKIEVLPSSDFPVPRNSKTPACDRIIGLLKRKRVRAITVPAYFPVGLAQKIAARGINLTVAAESLFPEREIKTSREVELISHAQKAAVKAMDRAVALIANAGIARDRSLKIGNKPLTAAAVRAAIDNTVRDYGCICYGTIVACGQQAANPHETGWGTLRADKAIVIDIFPQHIASGYWGDLTRTVAKGTPTPQLQKMFSTVRDAQKAAMAKIKAGVKASVVHNAAVDLFAQRGFATGRECGRAFGFIHGIGHGIGLEIHEHPSVGLTETKLKEGNVITVEPGLYYPGRAGIRTEDIVLVGRHDCRKIAARDYPFIV